MFFKVGRILIKKFLHYNTGHSLCLKKINIKHQHLIQHGAYFSQISYDDKRFQKHLNYISDLLNKSNGHILPDNEFYYDNRLLNHLIHLKEEVEKYESELQELNMLISDLKKQEDELLNTALSEKKNLEEKLQLLKDEVINSIVPDEIVDDKNLIMELTAGVGGQEAMLFAKDMFEMYCRYAQWKGWDVELLKFDETGLGGIRAAHLGINGSNAFKILKFESGVHRVQRIPKTEKAGRIHTSTMTVAVLPQPSEIDIVINPNDIELEFKRSGGAGGQHVNTTDSCVRIYHKPSGIVVESQMERNQHKNRELAMKSLRAKLYERKLEAIVKETKSARKLQIGSAGRSEKVRTYNFPQDRITDHRAHINIYHVESFLKGDTNLDNLLDMLQDWSRKQSLFEILNKYDST